MSNQLDTRELQERLDELDGLKSTYDTAVEEYEEAKAALENYSRNKDEIPDDTEDKKLEKLKDKLEEKAEEMEEALMPNDDIKELEELKALEEEVGGEWRHGVQLIPEDDFEAYCQELCEDIGDIPKDLPHYIVIDWKATCNNLRHDYAEIEFQGETYLYRV